MSADVINTNLDNNLNEEDKSNALNPTNTLVTEDEEIHIVEEGDDGFLFVERRIKGVPAIPETESTIKQFFPNLSPIHRDGEQNKVVASGRPKGITDISQLYSQPNETFQSEQIKQRERLEKEQQNVKDITNSCKDKIEEMKKKHDQEVLEHNNKKLALEKETSDLQRRLVEEQQHVKDITNSCKDKIEEMKKKHDQEVVEHNNKKLALENENYELQRRLEKEQQNIKDITNSCKDKIEEMKKKHDQEVLEHNNKNLALENETSELQRRIKALNETLQSYKQREATIVAKYSNELFEWKSQSNNQSEQISELKRKIEELLNRLSKLAEGRLTHENTNITDLSDTDKPTKLSEVYSELYDNQCTDAFEELTLRHDFDEQEAITKLLKILLVSFHRCKEITWQRYHTMKEVATTLDILNNVSSCAGMVREDNAKEGNEKMDWDCNKDQNKATVKHLTGTLTIDQEKQIKTIWRTTTNEFKDEAVKHLHIVLLMEFGISSNDYPHTSNYLASCIDLCWKMGVQEKPMHLDTLAEKEDGRERIFDLDKFRAYTKPGKRVAFLVWRALFLHEGGGMLVKGIAQGCKEIDN